MQIRERVGGVGECGRGEECGREAVESREREREEEMGT